MECGHLRLTQWAKKCVVSQKGQKTLQIVTGSDRDNTTVLAAAASSGVTLPPLIVFQGKQVQTTWRPSSDPTSEHFPWVYANGSVWMKADVFHEWFVEWEGRARTTNNEGKLETCLMIYDGHLCHFNYATIKLARETMVAMLKLLPHTTDLLQPLTKMGSSVIQAAAENLKCTVKVRIRNNNI